jgi:NNP family nitrate/nitrite transporter-like MFS transporter
MTSSAFSVRSLMALSPAAQLDAARGRVLTLSTTAFTVLFAAWLMFGVLALPMRTDLHLTDTQLAWLMAVVILNGSVWRLLFGVWAQQHGPRRMMTALLLFSAVPCFLLSSAQSFESLLFYAFLVGLAGNGFPIGIVWCSSWYPAHRQGLALGVFGAGNVGASVTKLIGPAVIAAVPSTLLGGWLPGGWRIIPTLYGALLIVMAALAWRLAPADPATAEQRRAMKELLTPLREVRVWRFSLYYVLVFGAYVALSLWLPKYYVEVFGFSLDKAALLTALYIFPASLLRPLGGWLSDWMGARTLMYWVLGALVVSFSALAVPNGTYSLPLELGVLEHQLEWLPFTAVMLVVGIAMGIGKAAVYKYIPQYFPRDVGAVGGLVGCLGALGGFVLPPLFVATKSALHAPESIFLVLLGLSIVSFVWLHATVRRLAKG